VIRDAEERRFARVTTVFHVDANDADMHCRLDRRREVLRAGAITGFDVGADWTLDDHWRFSDSIIAPPMMSENR
jgi:hypothetical protein